MERRENREEDSRGEDIEREENRGAKKKLKKDENEGKKIEKILAYLIFFLPSTSLK